MNNKKRQINIFFAIPCGDFFINQNECIKNVCEVAGVDPIIIEEQTMTSALWQEITNAIDLADYFIADISSNSPNILLELGYSIREKKLKYNAIFIQNSIEPPSDIKGFKFQKYGSLHEFRDKLIDWMINNIPIDYHNKDKLKSLKSQKVKGVYYHEDFKDLDRFIKFWSYPPGSLYRLTSEGLLFTNAHFPIMTTHLALLENYEFEFKAKIKVRTLGWIVKGTRKFGTNSLVFCIMFNINKKHKLLPHIFTSKDIHPATHYQVFNTEKKTVKLNLKEGWFTLITRVDGDRITISNDKKIIFGQNFTIEPYKKFYEFPKKQGEVGFRCSPNEEAIINYVKVREI